MAVKIVRILSLSVQKHVPNWKKKWFKRASFPTETFAIMSSGNLMSFFLVQMFAFYDLSDFWAVLNPPPRCNKVCQTPFKRTALKPTPPGVHLRRKIPRFETKKKSRRISNPGKDHICPPKFNSEFTPERWWLEDDPFLLGFGNFSGVMLNFGWVSHLRKRRIIDSKLLLEGIC